jgi:hypothetical protein
MSLGPEGKAQCGCACPQSDLIAVVGVVGHLDMRLVYIGGGSDLILAWFNVVTWDFMLWSNDQSNKVNFLPDCAKSVVDHA